MVDLTAANGDILHYTTTGTTCQDDSGAYNFTGTYTISGGTGCFAGATGRGTATSQVILESSAGGSTTISDKGLINLEKRSRCRSKG